jgi:ABC-type multidrug transport system fused ATPase/permease subunit
MNYTLKNEKIDNKKGLQLILGEFWKYKKQLSLILLCLLITTLSSVFVPQLLKYGIDEGINKSDVAKLWFLSGVFVALLVIMAFTFVIQTRLTGKLGQKVLLDLRAKVFAKLQELPMEFFGQNQSGDIIQRLTGNVEGINSFFSEGFVRLVNIIFSMFGFLTIMLVMNQTLGLMVVASVILVLIYLFIQGHYLNRFLKTELDNDGNVSSQTQEILHGFQIVKIYEKEKAFNEAFIAKNKVFLKSALKADYLSGISDGFLPFLLSTSTLIIVLFSLSIYTTGKMSQGDIIAFLTYIVTFYRRFDGISGLWTNIQTGLASAARITELLQLNSNITSAADAFAPELSAVKGKIEFRNVSFSYDKQNPVLSNINIAVEPGQTIAVVGPTGGGKTSFVSLIARLYDADQGEIIIDDTNIKNWDLFALRRSIGYLIQESIFFTGTILENILYDNPKATAESALQVLKDLGGETFLDSLPLGLDTPINSDSKMLSAGQRQILALTRLILRDPKILILDEATANIDTKSEKTIQKAIDLIKNNKTTFIIAHRLSTIFNADKIILIQNNTILESGNHEELIALHGKYYELYSKFVGKNTDPVVIEPVIETSSLV